MPPRWQRGAEPVRGLETIEKALAQMAGDIEAGGLGTQGGVSFGITIASATKGALQVYIMKNVWEFISVGIRENLLHLYAQPANIEKIHQQHTDIYLSIRSGDADAALAGHETSHRVCDPLLPEPRPRLTVLVFFCKKNSTRIKKSVRRRF